MRLLVAAGAEDGSSNPAPLPLLCDLTDPVEGNREAKSAKLRPDPVIVLPFGRELKPPLPEPDDLSPSLRLINPPPPLSLPLLADEPLPSSLSFFPFEGAEPSSSISNNENELRFVFLSSSDEFSRSEGTAGGGWNPLPELLDLHAGPKRGRTGDDGPPVLELMGTEFVFL